MELRGCSQVHFISVIRRDEVNKLHNIARGNSVLKFRNIGDIYGFDDGECQDSLAKCPPKVDRSLAMPCVDEQTTEVKIDPMEEENELDFGEITLRQLKQKCKSKKRKASKPVQFADVKQEVIDISFGEDLELKETLVSWKRKVLKKPKAKKKHTSKRGSMLSSLALVNISSEMFKPLRIKVEDPEPVYSQPQAISFILNDEPGNLSRDIVDKEYCWPDQDLRSTSEDLRSGFLDEFSDEYIPEPLLIEASTCSFNQVSYEHLDHVGFQDQFPENSEHENFREDNSSVFSNDQPLVFRASENPREEDLTDPMICDEAPETVLSECDNFDFQDVCPRYYALEAPPDTDNVMESEAPCTGPGGSQMDEFADPVEGSHSVDDSKSVEEAKSSVMDCDLTVKNDKSSLSCTSVASLDNFDSAISHNEQSSVVDVATINVQSPHLCTSVVEDKQSSVQENTISPLPCSPDIQPCEAVEQLAGSPPSERSTNKMMPHPPERLFSARKTISPNSQERLRKAMNIIESQDDTEIHSCKEDLLLEKNEVKSSISRPNNKRPRIIFTSKRHEALFTAAEIRTQDRQAVKRGKDERKLSHSKSYANGPHTSDTSQHAASMCSSVQRCSQNATAFSQQQIKDVEKLATKLMNELQSMKAIIVDGLQYESRAGAKCRYNTDQARIAVESATKTEGTAKKWMAMMTKDCNRFCRLMKLFEADAASPAASPEKPVPKERKIMFADEAGGKLCNIKIFQTSETETDMGVATPVKPQITKGEP